MKSRTIRSGAGSVTSPATSISCPAAASSASAARCAATGMKMSRPWKVGVTRVSHRSRLVRLNARAAPPAAVTAQDSRPLSGPMKTESPAATAIPRLAVPTPGSTTATCTDGGR